MGIFLLKELPFFLSVTIFNPSLTTTL